MPASSRNTASRHQKQPPPSIAVRRLSGSPGPPAGALDGTERSIMIGSLRLAIWDNRRAVMLDPIRFVARVVARMREVDLGRVAASLSFTTLLAIVPLATVTVALVAHFPLFDDWLRALEQFLLRHLLPFSAAAEVRVRVTEFADQAVRLSGISIAVVVATAVLAIATVEREINAIWGVRDGRSIGRRLVVYTLGLTAGPVLIGASISLTTWLVVHSLAV